MQLQVLGWEMVWCAKRAAFVTAWVLNIASYMMRYHVAGIIIRSKAHPSAGNPWCSEMSELRQKLSFLHFFGAGVSLRNRCLVERGGVWGCSCRYCQGRGRTGSFARSMCFPAYLKATLGYGTKERRLDLQGLRRMPGDRSITGAA